MSIIEIKSKQIRLNSGITEAAFGKTKYESVVTEQGLLCTADIKDNKLENYTFTPWTFSEIKAFDTPASTERVVFYCGPSSGFTKDALPLNELLEGENSFSAGYFYCSLLTHCAKEDISLPKNGLGGILAQITEKKVSFLFLPNQLFLNAAGVLPKEQTAALSGYWLNTTLKGLPSICFERAVTAYKILTGRLPYTATDVTERNADILDQRFIPVEMCVNNLNKELAGEINRGLKLNANAVTLPGKKQKGKTSEDLTPKADFPLELLLQTQTEQKITRLTEEEYTEKTASFLKQQTAKIKTRRNIRRNSSTIIVVAVIVLVLAWITGNTINTKLDNKTQVGLTSSQVVEAFYKGVNDRDTEFLTTITRGKNPSRYVDTVSQIYVIGKQRQVYSKDKGILSPEGWLLYNTDLTKDSSSGVFGVSNVKIDGKLTNLNPEIKTRREKPEPITKENSITLQKKDKSVHNVEYFFMHTEGEDSRLVVEYVKETVTLTYLKDRWYITNLETETENLKVNSNQFKSDYYETIALTDSDVIRACQLLIGKYPWIPESEVIKIEYDKLQDIVKNPFNSL